METKRLFSSIGAAMYAIRKYIIERKTLKKEDLLIKVDANSQLASWSWDENFVVLALRDEKTGFVHLLYDPEYVSEIVAKYLNLKVEGYIGHMVISKKEEVEKYLPLLEVTPPWFPEWDNLL